MVTNGIVCDSPCDMEQYEFAKFDSKQKTNK